MATKIYFCGSIKGGRQDRGVYAELIKHLSLTGEVLTEHIADPNVGIDHHLSDKTIHDRDIAWLREADVVVAEVTQPSLGVGYEIGRALEWGKRIIALYRPVEGRRLSAMIAGSEQIKTHQYHDLNEAFELLDRELR